MKFPIKDCFSKYDKICSFRIVPTVLKSKRPIIDQIVVVSSIFIAIKLDFIDSISVLFSIAFLITSRYIACHLQNPNVIDFVLLSTKFIHNEWLYPMANIYVTPIVQKRIDTRIYVSKQKVDKNRRFLNLKDRTLFQNQYPKIDKIVRQICIEGKLTNIL